MILGICSMLIKTFLLCQCFLPCSEYEIWDWINLFLYLQTQMCSVNLYSSYEYKTDLQGLENSVGN